MVRRRPPAAHLFSAPATTAERSQYTRRIRAHGRHGDFVCIALLGNRTVNVRNAVFVSSAETERQQSRRSDNCRGQKNLVLPT